MSLVLDTSRWAPLGETSNTRYFKLRDRIIVGVPLVGSSDDAKSARENVDFQVGYFRAERPGVVIIFFDNLVSQDKGARAIYQTMADPALMLGTAFVGGTLLSRAMGSFFMGLSRPKVPVKMFGSLEDASSWADARITHSTAEPSA